MWWGGFSSPARFIGATLLVFAVPAASAWASTTHAVTRTVQAVALGRQRGHQRDAAHRRTRGVRLQRPRRGGALARVGLPDGRSHACGPEPVPAWTADGPGRGAGVDGGCRCRLARRARRRARGVPRARLGGACRPVRPWHRRDRGGLGLVAHRGRRRHAGDQRATARPGDRRRPGAVHGGRCSIRGRRREAGPPSSGCAWAESLPPPAPPTSGWHCRFSQPGATVCGPTSRRPPGSTCTWWPAGRRSHSSRGSSIAAAAGAVGRDLVLPAGVSRVRARGDAGAAAGRSRVLAPAGGRRTLRPGDHAARGGGDAIRPPGGVCPGGRLPRAWRAVDGWRQDGRTRRAGGTGRARRGVHLARRPRVDAGARESRRIQSGRGTGGR